MRRSVAAAIGARKMEIKLHEACGDKNYKIFESVFTTNFKLQNIVMSYIEYDPIAYGYEVKRNKIDTADNGTITKEVEALGYDRQPYAITSIDYIDRIKPLSKKAFMLWKYIIGKLPLNSNAVTLPASLVMAETHEKYYNNANKYINELVKQGLIARSKSNLKDDLFVVNHNVFFKGNFTQFIHKYNKMFDPIDKSDDPFCKNVVNEDMSDYGESEH